MSKAQPERMELQRLLFDRLAENRHVLLTGQTCMITRICIGMRRDCTMRTMLRCVASERTVFMLTLYFVCILYMRAACGERRPLELAWKTPPPTGLVWPEQPPVPWALLKYSVGSGRTLSLIVVVYILCLHFNTAHSVSG